MPQMLAAETIVQSSHPSMIERLRSTASANCPQMPVKLRHQRAETLSGGVEGDQGDARFANVGAGADLTGDAGQDALPFTHHEDLVRTTGAPGPVAPFGEEGDRQVEDFARAQAADRLLLKGGSLQLLVPGGCRRGRCIAIALCHRYCRNPVTLPPCDPATLVYASNDSPGARMTTRASAARCATLARNAS